MRKNAATWLTPVSRDASVLPLNGLIYNQAEEFTETQTFVKRTETYFMMQ